MELRLSIVSINTLFEHRLFRLIKLYYNLKSTLYFTRNITNVIIVKKYVMSVRNKREINIKKAKIKCKYNLSLIVVNCHKRLASNIGGLLI